MAKAVNVSIRIDEDVMREIEQLFGELGLILSAVVGCVSISPVRNLFLNFPNGLTIHR